MTWKHGEPRHYFAVVKTCGRIARGGAAIYFFIIDTPRRDQNEAWPGERGSCRAWTPEGVPFAIRLSDR